MSVVYNYKPIDSEAEYDEINEDSPNGMFFTSAEEGLPHLSAEGRVCYSFQFIIIFCRLI